MKESNILNQESISVVLRLCPYVCVCVNLCHVLSFYPFSHLNAPSQGSDTEKRLTDLSWHARAPGSCREDGACGHLAKTTTFPRRHGVWLRGQTATVPGLVWKHFVGRFSWWRRRGGRTRELNLGHCWERGTVERVSQWHGWSRVILDKAGV